MKRALISVSDKKGVVEFARELVSLGYEIISTGGTEKELVKNGVKVLNVSDITGFPECLDGRVKTLHPSVHAGILAVRRNKEHMASLKELNIGTIDIVAVNLYPFRETILKEGASHEEIIENIDIGGPAMIRAAAKNYEDVAVISDPKDYEKVIAELKETGEVSCGTRLYLCAKVFAHTSGYDTLIASYLAKKAGMPEFPDTITLTYEKVQDMRYGENPHQRAAFYKEISTPRGMLTDAVQLHGKELSFNNINDTHGALELLREFDEPAVVASKHSNPCGVGSGESIYEAYMKAYTSDPVSVFGGIIVANREIDEKTAEEINKIFVEIVLAPSFSDKALQILSGKKNIRLLTLSGIENKEGGRAIDIKKVSGGILIQSTDNVLLDKEGLKTVTDRTPTEKEMEDMLFAWKIVKYVKSNGIAIAKDKQSIGIGPGQVNRIWACMQAIEHGVKNLSPEAVKGAALASDAYFPFSDCVEECAKAGITAVIQPGGSIRDQESIDACNKYGIAMVFTGMRHFRH